MSWVTSELVSVLTTTGFFPLRMHYILLTSEFIIKWNKFEQFFFLELVVPKIICRVLNNSAQIFKNFHNLAMPNTSKNIPGTIFGKTVLFLKKISKFHFH